jgi:predicted alpha/beta-fold hydrolase
VVLFHGLAGSYKSPYIQGMMRALGVQGFSVVLMHFRGCGAKPNRLPRSYHSGETVDAKSYLSHLKKSYPNALLFAVGYSLGGNMLLKMLGEFGVQSPIMAAVSVSPPMQLEVSADTMNRGFSKLYQAYLLRDLKKSLLKKYKLHNMKSLINVDEEGVKKLSSFWEFDDAYTAPIHGFSSAKDYYSKSSSKQYLKNIQTDTLVILSLDDPFMTPEVLPHANEYSKKVKFEIHEHGGHVGFISGTLFKPQFYLQERVVRYFKKFI